MPEISPSLRPAMVTLGKIARPVLGILIDAYPQRVARSVVIDGRSRNDLTVAVREINRAIESHGWRVCRTKGRTGMGEGPEAQFWLEPKT